MNFDEVKNSLVREMLKSAEKLNLSYSFLLSPYFTISSKEKEIWFSESMPSTTNAVAYRITENKFATNKLLKKYDLPVAAMEKFIDNNQVEKFLDKYKSIVIKPIFGIHGKGITVGLTKKNDINTALSYAEDYDKKKRILLEEYCEGEDYRILVIGRKKVFVVNRKPALIYGDGKSTINILLKKYNEESGCTFKVKDDFITKETLRSQGFSLESILQKDALVYLRKTANIKSGGISIDVTESINPVVKDQAIKICDILDLDIAGIDYISPNISDAKGKFIEINAYPDIMLHKKPIHGKSYDVTKELLMYLFLPEKF